MHKYQRGKISKIKSLLYAPFVTIGVSLQLSVLEHKNLYGDITKAELSKELINIPKEITVRERKAFEL